ncbi:hypothetical protein FUAX_01250 [Fulvitalea axinellae]|uniref:Uncharacterized protein n=1 Tax=Fulvitalea axinellae TaxID=1182444 RepID=A0AAU9CD72_9BACT|nr:hypothetical protein FUAX_01250 [Fulvitalea axinellae]
MIQVSQEIIDKVASELSGKSEAQAEQIMQAFSQEQPFVLGYGFLMEERLENPGDFELLVFVLTLIWACFKELSPELQPVTDDVLADAAEVHMNESQATEDLAGKTDEEIAKMMHDRISKENQAPLLEFLSGFVYNSTFGQDNLMAQGVILSVGTIAVKAFDKSVNG